MRESDEEILIRDFASREDYLACLALQDDTWGSTFSERVPPAILKVSQRIGGVAAGAYRGGVMIGFVFGMTGVRDGRLVHWSDMLAVRPRFQGHGVGQRLKWYQRQRVQELGVEVMYWTFDPLVARNAHFNIHVLGAEPVEYVEDMYGSQTGSALHGGLPTDRLVVSWALTRAADRAPWREEGAGDAAEQRTIVAMGNPVGTDGTPLVREPDDAPMVGVQVPRDFAEIQRAGGERAMRWRLSVRTAIVSLFKRGYRVAEFVRAAGGALPHYVFAPSSRGSAP